MLLSWFSLFFRNLPHGCRLGSVTPMMIQTVVDRWEKSIDSTHEYVRACIDAFPSSALIAPDGHLVSFAIRKYTGDVGFLHVDPNYRRRSYGSIVFGDIFRKIMSVGFPAYSFVEHGNEDSRMFHNKMGSKETKHQYHYILQFKPDGK